MAKQDKRAAARSLYMTGNYTQDEIGRMLSISAATLTKYKQEEGWDEEKAYEQSIIDSSESIVRELVHYNLMILRGKARRGLKNLEAKEGQEGKVVDAADLTLISGKEVDGLSKLFAQIKRKDLMFADHVNMVTTLLDFVSKKDKAFAETLTAYTDEYIQELTKKNRL